MNYENYRRMFKNAEVIQEELTALLNRNLFKVYSVFVSVGNEDKGTYFIDAEFVKPITGYTRIYGNYTEAQVNKMLGKEI